MKTLQSRFVTLLGISLLLAWIVLALAGGGRLGALGSLLVLAVVWAAAWPIAARMTSPFDRVTTALRSGSGTLTPAPAEDLLKGPAAPIVQSITRLAQDVERVRREMAGGLGRVDGMTRDLRQVSSQISRQAMIQLQGIETAGASIAEMASAIRNIAESTGSLASSAVETSSSVLEMTASADQVAEATETLSGAVEQSVSAIDQMGASIREIAASVERLSGAAERTVSAMTEIDASIREVEGSAKSSAGLAERVKTAAIEEGMMTIADTIAGMEKIQETVARSSQIIARLSERSREVGKILTVIKEVTDRTSLLALNAAILAAQAGEHGKGFSVVADEIKELAERTASSTKEIETIIKAVQAEAAEAVSAAGEGQATAEEGMKFAMETGGALKKIMETAKESSELAGWIERAAGEQARGAQDVFHSMTQVGEMVGQIARAIQEQRAGTEAVVRSAEQVRDITSHVKRAMAEQSKGSHQISRAVETITEQVQRINTATHEQEMGSREVLDSIESIREATQEGVDGAVSLDLSIETLQKEFAGLRSILTAPEEGAGKEGGT
ncbi:MAG: methyl-accepting chemotaxis protein [Nitrospirota bacterium]|mgnify:CR=1 FL=1